MSRTSDTKKIIADMISINDKFSMIKDTFWRMACIYAIQQKVFSKANDPLDDKRVIQTLTHAGLPIDDCYGIIGCLMTIRDMSDKIFSAPPERYVARFYILQGLTYCVDSNFDPGTVERNLSTLYAE